MIFIPLILILLVNGYHFLDIKFVQVTVGSPAILPCSLSGYSTSGKWSRSMPASSVTTINYKGSMVGSFGSTMSISGTSDLKINNVTATDLNYIYRCLDTATFQNYAVVILTTSKASQCESNSLYTLISAPSGSSVTISCNVTSTSTLPYTGFLLFAATASDTSIAYNGSLSSGKSSDYSIKVDGLVNTLTIKNLKEYSFYICYNNGPVEITIDFISVCPLATSPAVTIQSSCFIIYMIIAALFYFISF